MHGGIPADVCLYVVGPSFIHLSLRIVIIYCLVGHSLFHHHFPSEMMDSSLNELN